MTKTSLLQGLGYWFFLPSYNHVIKIVKDTWLGAVTVKGSLASRAGKWVSPGLSWVLELYLGGGWSCGAGQHPQTEDCEGTGA